MIGTNLVLHRGGHDIEENDLRLVPTPPPTDTWFPLPHSQLLDSVKSTLGAAGFQIERQRLSVSHEGQRFFGTLDLSTKISDGVALAVGIRNSNDKSFPIGWCCGNRVFLCDNLAFTSEIIISKKHTRFGQERYLEGLSRAVASLGQYKEAASNWINRLQRWQLSREEADSLILQAYEKSVISSRLLPQVINEWRHPEHEEFSDQNGWCLWNAFTTVLGRMKQSTHPAEAALTTIRLQGLFNAPEVVDGFASAV